MRDPRPALGRFRTPEPRQIPGPSPFPGPAVVVGPRCAALLCACAGVSSAATLGMTSMVAPWIGLPLGVWVIGAVVGCTHLALDERSFVYRLLQGAPDLLGSVRGFLRTPVETPDFAGLIGTVRERLPSPGRILKLVQQSEAGASASYRRQSGPVRIAVHMPTSEAAGIVRAAEERSGTGAAIAVWVNEEGAGNSGMASPRTGVVVLRDEEDGSVVVRTVRHGACEPAWADWSSPMPLGYAGVFPLRLDPDAITLEGTNPTRREIARVIVKLAEAAGVLTQAAGRLGMNRRPRSGTGVVQPRTAGVPERAMRELAAALKTAVASSTDAKAAVGDPACSAAARVLSAWAATSDSTLTPEERLAVAQLAEQVLPNEAEVVLRLAAAQFASYDDEEATRTLRRAHRMLRQRGKSCQVDPLAFILSELELGSAGNLTLGRVASGICLLWATAPDSSLKYLRDDLVDDLRHAGWLMGREQDTRLLKEVITLMERARAEDSGGTLPRAEAA